MAGVVVDILVAPIFRGRAKAKPDLGPNRRDSFLKLRASNPPAASGLRESFTDHRPSYGCRCAEMVALPMSLPAPGTTKIANTMPQ